MVQIKCRRPIDAIEWESSSHRLVVAFSRYSRYSSNRTLKHNVDHTRVKVAKLILQMNEIFVISYSHITVKGGEIAKGKNHTHLNVFVCTEINVSYRNGLA